MPVRWAATLFLAMAEIAPECDGPRGLAVAIINILIMGLFHADGHRLQ
jgi:hypothetical protein